MKNRILSKNKGCLFFFLLTARILDDVCLKNTESVLGVLSSRLVLRDLVDIQFMLQFYSEKNCLLCMAVTLVGLRYS